MGIKNLVKLLVHHGDDSVTEEWFKKTKTGELTLIEQTLSCAQLSKVPKRVDDQYAQQGRVALFAKKGIRRYGETRSGDTDSD